jgi:hypothetical protein
MDRFQGFAFMKEGECGRSVPPILKDELANLSGLFLALHGGLRSLDSDWLAGLLKDEEFWLFEGRRFSKESNYSVFLKFWKELNIL